MNVVRPATHADIPEIVRMGRLFWDQTALRDIPFCPDSIAFTCREMMANELLLMAEVDGHIAGSVGATAAPMYANRSYFAATELFWWVEPQFRDSGIGRMMLKGIEDAARQRAVQIFSMIALEQVEPEKAAAIYARAGYTPTERAFTKRL